MATAYAALVSLENILDLIQNHPRHSFSFDNKQMESLNETVSFLIDLMESYDNNTHGAGRDEALERRIACAAHAAEDVMESHVVDQIRSGSTLSGKTTSRFLLDLQKVIEGMAFVRRKAVLHAKKDHQINGFKAVPPISSTTLTSEKNAMVGVDDVFVHLMDLLTGEPSSLRVIPIVGTGGIGKTTLARNASSHPLIVQHFDVCLWATISQHYVTEDILLQLLSQRRKSNSESVRELGGQLHQSLYGRRYLLILDDMWSVEAWDEVKFFFPDTNNGSRIILTSRLSDLMTDHFGSLSLAMKFLDEGKSWDLFCAKAFTEQVCPPESEETGKKIVEMCKGLPLAIVVVGGHLGKSPRTQEYWESAANQYMNSTLNVEENESFFNILSLSYNHLHICLKSCFLYIGTFREDEEIFVSDLIKLWVAEGCLKPNETHSLEEVAEDYVNKLIDRNLILAYTRRWNGKVRSCKIHDILRELCLKIAAKEKFLCVLHTPRAIHRERRVVTNERVPEELHHPRMFHALRSATLVRSLKCEGGLLSFDLKLLRVLHKVDSALMNEANFQQVNLRYLKVDLEFNKRYHSFYLTPSISLLWSLQTLIIGGIYQPTVIAPYEIWELLQLRHVEVDRICLPDPLPMMSDRLDQENDLVLQNLQTLFDVENFKLSEEVCRRIPNIKVLFITYNDCESKCDEVRSYYCPHNLGRFHKLEYLACSFGFDSKWRDVASNLTFPSCLTLLALTNSRFDWEELTIMVGSLPHLANLGLYENSVLGSEWTPIEGKFLCLKTLTIWGCHDLVYWNANSAHFPVLENIFLRDLSKLIEFPSGIGEIPTLGHIDLSGCSMSLAISAITMLVEQEMHGNEGFMLSISFGDDRESLESFNKELEDEGLTRDRLHLYYNAGRERACDKFLFYSSLGFALI